MKMMETTQRNAIPKENERIELLSMVFGEDIMFKKFNVKRNDYRKLNLVPKVFDTKAKDKVRGYNTHIPISLLDASHDFKGLKDGSLRRRGNDRKTIKGVVVQMMHIIPIEYTLFKIHLTEYDSKTQRFRRFKETQNDFEKMLLKAKEVYKYLQFVEIDRKPSIQWATMIKDNYNVDVVKYPKNMKGIAKSGENKPYTYVERINAIWGKIQNRLVDVFDELPQSQCKELLNAILRLYFYKDETQLLVLKKYKDTMLRILLDLEEELKIVVKIKKKRKKIQNN